MASSMPESNRYAFSVSSPDDQRQPGSVDELSLREATTSGTLKSEETPRIAGSAGNGAMLVRWPAPVEPPSARAVPRKPFYSVEEAALVLGLGGLLVQDLVARGVLEARKAGTQLGITPEQIDAYRPTAQTMEDVARLGFAQDEVISYLDRTRRRPPWTRADQDPAQAR